MNKSSRDIITDGMHLYILYSSNRISTKNHVGMHLVLLSYSSYYFGYFLILSSLLTYRKATVSFIYANYVNQALIA